MPQAEGMPETMDLDKQQIEEGEILQMPESKEVTAQTRDELAKLAKKVAPQLERQAA